MELCHHIPCAFIAAFKLSTGKLQLYVNAWPLLHTVTRATSNGHFRGRRTGLRLGPLLVLFATIVLAQVSVDHVQRESSTNFAGFPTKENKIEAEAPKRNI
jgi:hypothetical protein